MVHGDPAPRMELWSRRDPVTLLGAAGMSKSGWDELSRIFRWVASRFSNVSDFQFDVEVAGVSGDLAYSVGYERFNGRSTAARSSRSRSASRTSIAARRATGGSFTATATTCPPNRARPRRSRWGSEAPAATNCTPVARGVRLRESAGGPTTSIPTLGTDPGEGLGVRRSQCSKAVEEALHSGRREVDEQGARGSSPTLWKVCGLPRGMKTNEPTGPGSSSSPSLKRTRRQSRTRSRPRSHACQRRPLAGGDHVSNAVRLPSVPSCAA